MIKTFFSLSYLNLTTNIQTSGKSTVPSGKVKLKGCKIPVLWQFLLRILYFMMIIKTIMKYLFKEAEYLSHPIFDMAPNIYASNSKIYKFSMPLSVQQDIPCFNIVFNTFSMCNIEWLLSPLNTIIECFIKVSHLQSSYDI